MLSAIGLALDLVGAGIRRTAQRFPARVFSVTSAAVTLATACGGSSGGDVASSMPTTLADPCAPTATEADPCGHEYNDWRRRFSRFEEVLNAALLALDAGSLSPENVLEEADADEPSSGMGVLEAVATMRSCSEDLEEVGEPPGGALDEDNERLMAYRDSCIKFEAAAAVFDRAIPSRNRAVVAAGQDLVADGAGILCRARGGEITSSGCR